MIQEVLVAKWLDADKTTLLARVKDENGTAGTHTILILASGSQKIDDHSSVRLESPFAAINIYSNGTDKYFIF